MHATLTAVLEAYGRSLSKQHRLVLHEPCQTGADCFQYSRYARGSILLSATHSKPYPGIRGTSRIAVASACDDHTCIRHQ